VHGTDLEILCSIGHNAQEWRDLIHTLKDLEITNEHIEARVTKLREIFDNQKNAERIISLCK